MLRLGHFIPLMLTPIIVVLTFACGSTDVQPTGSGTATDHDQDPRFWLGQLEAGSSRGEALSRLKALLQERLDQADGLTDDPAVEGYVAQVSPALIEGFVSGSITSGGEDMAARNSVVELLAMMESEEAVLVYEQALTDIEGDRVKGAQTAAGGIADLCRSKSYQAMFIPPQSVQTSRWRARCGKAQSSVVPLLSTLEAVRLARVKRGPNAANTPVEDALTGALVSALGNVLLGTPDHPRKDEVIAALSALAEDSDTTQDLYINIEAIRFLGRIGDRRAIPVLIRGLFIEGQRRPLVLKEIARVALMHIDGLDSVASALVKAGRMEDESLNQMQEADSDFDVRMIKEQVAVTLGQLGVRSDDVMGYLMEELEHSKVDGFDRIPPRGSALGHITEATSKAYRRMFAAQALGQLRHEPALPIIVSRMKLRPSKTGVTLADRTTDPAELPGYLDALGDFLMPAQTNDVFLAAMELGDDAFVDRAGRRLSLQAASELDTKLESRANPMEGSDARDFSHQIKNNFLNKYVPALRSGAGCITIECLAIKLADANAPVRERAAYQLALVAQEDGASSDRARAALIDALERERTDTTIQAIVFAIDRLSPHGASAQGLESLDQVMLNLQSRQLMDTGRLAITGLRGRLAGRAKLRHH